MPKAISDHCIPADSTSREDGRHPVSHLLMLRCCRTDRALRELVAVRASPGARAVVLHRAVPAGSRTSSRRNDVDDGERKREGQSDLAQHGHSPQVEARSGFCRLDRGTRRLFRAGNPTGVRPVQVFVCSKRCADHINVSRCCNRTSGHIRRAMFHFFDMSFGARQDHGEGHGIAWCRVAIVLFREASLRQIGSIGVEGHSGGIDRCYTSISSSCFWFACLGDAFAAVGLPNAGSRCPSRHCDGLCALGFWSDVL